MLKFIRFMLFQKFCANNILEYGKYNRRYIDTIIKT
jgi:hypothetical protein